MSTGSFGGPLFGNVVSLCLFSEFERWKFGHLIKFFNCFQNCTFRDLSSFPRKFFCIKIVLHWSIFSKREQKISDFWKRKSAGMSKLFFTNPGENVFGIVSFKWFSFLSFLSEHGQEKVELWNKVFDRPVKSPRMILRTFREILLDVWHK